MFDNLLNQMEKFSEFTDDELDLLFGLLKPASTVSPRSLWYSLWLGLVMTECWPRPQACHTYRRKRGGKRVPSE